MIVIPQILASLKECANPLDMTVLIHVEVGRPLEHQGMPNKFVKRQNPQLDAFFSNNFTFLGIQVAKEMI